MCVDIDIDIEDIYGTCISGNYGDNKKLLIYFNKKLHVLTSFVPSIVTSQMYTIFPLFLNLKENLNEQYEYIYRYVYIYFYAINSKDRNIILSSKKVLNHYTGFVVMTCIKQKCYDQGSKF